jgi:hypothetical protein
MLSIMQIVRRNWHSSIFFGNRTTRRMQAQILGQLKEEDALAFKESVYYECTMIAVSVGLLSLNLLEP